MPLGPAFIRLPLAFDAARLAEEIAPFEEHHWRPQADGGVAVLPLVCAGGDASTDGVKGPMRGTPHLARCPYVQEVLASLRSPIGRTRLVRIDKSGAAPPADASYYAAHRIRVHVPVVTAPAVTFTCGEQPVHMGAGEAWVLDPATRHDIAVPDGTPSVHLVCDTVPSDALRELLGGAAATDIAATGLTFETHNYPVVMSPSEQAALVERLEGVPSVVRWFLDDWREWWHRYGESPAGWPHYRALLDFFDAALESLPERERVRELLVLPALNRELAARPKAAVPPRRLERPVFILSPPRTGSTLLFRTLWRSPSVFTPGNESHEIIEGIPALHPAQHGWESNRLTAEDATPEVAAALEARYLAELRARDGGRILPRRVRMVDKTTKSLLRVPFLRALYPDAFFIWLHRDPRATISSLMDVWRRQIMVAYPDLPGWTGPPWTLTLVPGWREVNGRPLEEIVAHQWSEGIRVLLDDLESLDAGSWCAVSYEAFVAEPQKEIERLCALAGLGWDRELAAPLGHSPTTVSPPSPDKWRRDAEALERVEPRFRPVAERAREMLERAQGDAAGLLGARHVPRSSSEFLGGG